MIKRAVQMPGSDDGNTSEIKSLGGPIARAPKLLEEKWITKSDRMRSSGVGGFSSDFFTRSETRLVFHLDSNPLDYSILSVMHF